MNASAEDINDLMTLQSIDFKILKAQKAFEGLPQRQEIVDAREKKNQLASKLEAVDAMLAKAEKAITAIVEKDQCLEKRQAEIQKDIDNAGGDFRNLEARTKELAAQGEQREKLVAELEAAEGEKAKIDAVRRQIVGAIAKVEKVEAAAIESFKTEGGALQRSLAALQAERKALADEVNPELIKMYAKIAQASGGVAIGVLSDGRCGSCRVSLENARMVEVRKNAPLAVCPHCKRLLVVGL